MSASQVIVSQKKNNKYIYEMPWENYFSFLEFKGLFSLRLQYSKTDLHCQINSLSTVKV